MQYSKYFGAIIRENGMPNLTTEALQKFFNVIHLEGKLEGLKAAKKLNKTEPNQFDLKLFTVGKELTAITGNLEPKEFLEQLLRTNSSNWLAS
ncbi:MAG: hypothetical protein R2780_01675 [Crocinitomicaceae bacterium]